MANDFKGFLLVGMSALCFSMMSLFVKSCSLPSSQIVFIRSLFQTIISVVACAKEGVNPLGKREFRGLLFLRGIFGALAVGCYFYGVRYGNLSDNTSVFFTAPAMSTILASIFLKDQMRLSTVVSILLCAVGTCLVAKPHFLFPNESEVNPGESLALIVSIIGSFLSAAAYLMISVIGTKAHHLCLVFYFGVLSSLVSVIPMAVFRPTIPGWEDTGYLLGVVVFAYSGQVTLNYGLQMTANTATLIRNLDIVFAFIFSFFVFHERVSATSIIGAILICLGTGLIVLDKYQNRIPVDDLELPGSPTSPVKEPLLKKD